MTDPTVAPAERAEKGGDVDVLGQMVQFMGQRLMEIDVESRCGAGCRGRLWDARAGVVDLKIPKLQRRLGADEQKTHGCFRVWPAEGST